MPKGFKTINIFSLILFIPGVTVTQSNPIKKVRKNYRIIDLVYLHILPNLKVKYQFSKKMGCVPIYSLIILCIRILSVIRLHSPEQ